MNEFASRMAGPDPAACEGILRQIRGEVERRSWQDLIDYSGVGWFKNRFLYLFGEGLDGMQTCLDAWSSFIPPPTIFSSANIRTWARSIMLLLKSSKFFQPATPASTIVVVPCGSAASSATTVEDRPLRYTCVCRSTSPGVT